MRIEQLTFTRFLAAISIVFFHFGRDVFPFQYEFSSFLLLQTNIGVSYFYVLSGFVLVIAYGNKAKINAPEFYKNRFARTYPAHFIALVLLLIFILTASAPFDRTGLALNLILIQSWIPAKALSFNTPAWSLSVEFFFYLLFPYLFNKLYNRIHLKATTVLVLSLFIFTQLLFNIGNFSSFNAGYGTTSYNFLYYFPVMHLSSFMMGNLGALFFLKFWKNKRLNADIIIILLIIISISALYLKDYVCFHNGLMAVLFVPIILLFAINNGFISRICQWKPLVFLGEISYGIYILQIPVFEISKYVLNNSGITNSLAVFYISLITLLIVSGISYTFFENPLRNIIKSKHLRPN